MTGKDIAAALELCCEAGWNQVLEDWQRLIGYEPNGCFVAMSNGQLVGTVTTTRYGEELAWIGMMLTHRECRRQGVATLLMRTSIDYLRGHGVQCIKLDATPVGEHVYRKLGFVAEWTFDRLCREESSCAVRTVPIDALALSDSMLKLDRVGFGADRGMYLQLLGQDSLVHQTSNGFGMMRAGAIATYLGPILAYTPVAAASIVAELCARNEGTVFWDVPTPNSDALRLAQSLGFAPTRSLTRMRLGNPTVRPDMKLQFAIADPGTG